MGFILSGGGAQLFTVSELFFTFLEGFIIVCAFALLSGRKQFITKSKTKLFTFVFIYTLYTFWISSFIPFGIHTIVISCLTILILNITFDSTLSKSIIKAFAILISISIVETLISIFGLIVTSIPINILLKNNYYVLTCSIIAKIVEVICLILIYKSNISFSWLNDNDPPYYSKYKQILVIISAITAFMVSTNVYLSSNPDKAYIFNVFSFLFYIVLILAMISAFREGYKLELSQYANEMQKENIQQLTEFNEMVAKERHEYKNHLNTIYGLCTLNKPDTNARIKQYINNYANNSTTKNLSIDSGNDFVDAVINVKYNNGLKRGIEVRVQFDEPITLADIKEDVAVTVIANIIENAFEAMSNCSVDNKYVLLRTYTRNGRYFISISNNGPMIPEADRLKIFNAGFSTKDNPSKTRGFGLSIVQNEITRFHGEICIKSDTQVTEFLISFKAHAK